MNKEKKKIVVLAMWILSITYEFGPTVFINFSAQVPVLDRKNKLTLFDNYK